MRISNDTLFMKIRFLLFSVILGGIAGCNIPGLIQPTSVPPTLVPAGEQEISEAQVTFYIEIPVETPTDEPILLSVLDEVTGLALNAKRFQTEQLDDTHYSVTLPFKLFIPLRNCILEFAASIKTEDIPTKTSE